MMMDLDTRIPCEVNVGNETVGRGVKFQCLLNAIKRTNRYYNECFSENEKLKQRIADIEGAGKATNPVTSGACIGNMYITSTFVPTQKLAMDLGRYLADLDDSKRMQEENTALRGQVEALTAEAKDLTEQLKKAQKERELAECFSKCQELDKILRKPVSVGQHLYEWDPTSRKLLVWRVESLRYMEGAGLPPMDFWTVGLKRVQMDGTLGKLFCFMAADIGVTLFKTPVEAFKKAGVGMGGITNEQRKV